MKINNTVSVSINELLDYLGADNESRRIVETLKKSAVSELLSGIGTDEVDDKYSGLVDEYILASVYLSFYTSRDDKVKPEFLERRKNQIAMKLELNGKQLRQQEAL